MHKYIILTSIICSFVKTKKPLDLVGYTAYDQWIREKRIILKRYQLDKNNNVNLDGFVSKYFSRANLRFNIHNLSYLPRWIIVMLDVSVLIIAFFFTYLIFRGTGLDYIITPDSLIFVSSFISVNVFFFWVFRTYSGIIRHSSYIDAVKL